MISPSLFVAAPAAVIAEMRTQAGWRRCEQRERGIRDAGCLDRDARRPRREERRVFGALGDFLPGVGVRGALDVVPQAVAPFYGGRAFGAGILSLRVAVMPMMHMSHGQM